MPPLLEQRVERSLRAAGLLGARRERGRRAVLFAALAAGLCCFAAGFGVAAARQRATTTDAAPRYVLLLYGAPGAVADPADVAEHRAWARRLAAAGHAVSGEKLVPNDAAGDGGLEGFFVVSAASDTEAEAIARGLPHRLHGGRVVVRRIEPT